MGATVPATPVKKFVRVTGVRQGRFVEFEFSINDADLMIELILPLRAFDEFCVLQEVTVLPPRNEAANEFEQLAWREKNPGLLRRVLTLADDEPADAPRPAKQ